MATLPSEDAEFGSLLRAYRMRALQSQEQLAARCGMSVRAIGALEQGRVRSPRGESVRLLATALGLSDEERRRFTVAARPAPVRTPQPPRPPVRRRAR